MLLIMIMMMTMLIINFVLLCFYRSNYLVTNISSIHFNNCTREMQIRQDFVASKSKTCGIH